MGLFLTLQGVAKKIVSIYEKSLKHRNTENHSDAIIPKLIAKRSRLLI